MLFKIIAVSILIIITISLFSALRAMVTKKEGDDQFKTVRFLAYRVGFSVLLLLLLMLAYFLGWIQPHGLRG